MVDNRTMRVIQSYGKSEQRLASIIRSTSCSRGWLRLVVQAIFGVIIVTSFILIVLMTIGALYKSPGSPKGRCQVISCTVSCKDVPYLGDYEDEILQATSEAETNCRRVFLKLKRPMFSNYSMPVHWLSGIRVNVSQLEIEGGNLMHILPDAFMTQFGSNLRILILEKITLTRLASDTFLGLSNLRELYIRDCNIIHVRQNALQAIDDTLITLTIKSYAYWDPVNITGASEFEQLRVVDFSWNLFRGILGRQSFSQLQKCKVLYLNWCGITSISPGAFDSLKSIEILHLNNNHLTLLPTDLFNKIIPLEPRIGLQDNLWHCSCTNPNLRILSKLGLLIVDPTCYYPTSVRGLTFSQFENYCEDDPLAEIIDENLYLFSERTNVTSNHHCELNSSIENSIFSLHSPLPEYTCASNRIQQFKSKMDTDLISKDNNWLQPSFSLDINGYFMVALVFSGPPDYGLLWYKSKCPNEVYCINHLPRALRVFNEDSSTQYTFCRVFFVRGEIIGDTCVAYEMAALQSSVFLYRSVLLYICVAIVCLLCGALCVYALIHQKPTLLKGNKRVVFVKHKTVDALVLPPKIPLRSNLFDDSNVNVGNSNNIFVIPKKDLLSENFMRTSSVRTTASNNASYISAIQPSEYQLTEWRIKRQLNFQTSEDSIDSTLPTFSRMLSTDSLPYYSLNGTEKIYETL